MNNKQTITHNSDKHRCGDNTKNEIQKQNVYKWALYKPAEKKVFQIMVLKLNVLGFLTLVGAFLSGFLAYW